MILKMVLDLPAEAAFVPLVRGLSATLLERLGVVQDDIDDASLVISEVCGNVVRHAYGQEELRYLVAVEYFEDRAEITVTDRGIGFEREAVRPPAPAQVGGWGIWLVEHVADKVEFKPVEDGTSVRATLDLHYVSHEARAQAEDLAESPEVGTMHLSAGDRPEA